MAGNVDMIDPANDDDFAMAFNAWGKEAADALKNIRGLLSARKRMQCESDPFDLLMMDSECRNAIDRLTFFGVRANIAAERRKATDPARTHRQVKQPPPAPLRRPEGGDAPSA